jgi:GNAT superfamily N-acetyltransferase
MSIDFYSAGERPDLVAPAEALGATLWPRYLSTKNHQKYRKKLYEPPLARFQSIAVDRASGEVVALGNCIPFILPRSRHLPDEGWDWVLEAGATAAARGEACDSLSALSVAIRPDRRGEGLAIKLLEAMKFSAVREGLSAMVAPVRPTLKHMYPLQDFETYCGWKTQDGLPFDPWLRTHMKMGATFLQHATCSMTVAASVDQWNSWTGLRFPESGEYWLPSALSVLRIDLEEDCGIYEEPNYWMRHPL